MQTDEFDVENPIHPVTTVKFKSFCYGNVRVDHWNLRPFLCRAALSGDWKAAKRFDASAYCLELTARGDRTLHIAAGSKQTEFVRNVIQCLTETDLELRNSQRETAFHIAAASGAVEIAKIMFNKNRDLPLIRGKRGMTPLETAAAVRNKEMVQYLYPITRIQHLSVDERFKIFIVAIQIDMFDIALNILNEDHSVASSSDNAIGALKVLARKPLSGPYCISQECWWEKLVISCFRRSRCISAFVMRREARELVERLWKVIEELSAEKISELMEESNILHVATKCGNVEFLTLLIPSNPDLLWIHDCDKHTILHVSVIYRQREVFSLLCHIGAVTDSLITLPEDEKINILHLAGKMPPTRRNNVVPGAALQMQRELLWFKEVEKIVPVRFPEEKNSRGETPEETFTREHENLQKDGEKWMKDTASSCMVVATLIATVAFAAAFTIPGGINQETGTPILLKQGWFTFFVMSDTVGMFSSTISIMIFLSILTSRYTDEDFLSSLPKKLVFGLLSLFASIVCLVVAFTAAFFLVYKEAKEGTKLPKLVAALAAFPVTLYVVLNFKLWIDIIRAAWTSRSMFQLCKQRLR